MITGSTYEYKANVINSILADIFFSGLKKLSSNEDRGEKEKIIQTANRYSRDFKDREIQFVYNNQITNGIFKGINSDGGLILEVNGDNRVLYYSGEIV